jgi:hypothetical protein
MTDRDKKRPVTEGTEEKGRALGEEEDDSRSTPCKDLAASAVIAGFALFVMVLALRMASPGSVFTAPGLLPFVTGLSLLIMAIGLGIRSVRRGGVRDLFQRQGKGVRKNFAETEKLRTLLLIGIIILYVIVTNQIGFDLRFPTGFFAFHFSSYELLSIICLTLILRIFWRSTLLRCFLVSVCWTLALASIFRYGFHILLPGLG